MSLEKPSWLVQPELLTCVQQILTSGSGGAFGKSSTGVPGISRNSWLSTAQFELHRRFLVCLFLVFNKNNSALSSNTLSCSSPFLIAKPQVSRWLQEQSEPSGAIRQPGDPVGSCSGSIPALRGAEQVALPPPPHFSSLFTLCSQAQARSGVGRARNSRKYGLAERGGRIVLSLHTAHGDLHMQMRTEAVTFKEHSKE